MVVGIVRSVNVLVTDNPHKSSDTSKNSKPQNPNGGNFGTPRHLQRPNNEKGRNRTRPVSDDLHRCTDITHNEEPLLRRHAVSQLRIPVGGDGLAVDKEADEAARNRHSHETHDGVHGVGVALFHANVENGEGDGVSGDGRGAVVEEPVEYEVLFPSDADEFVHFVVGEVGVACADAVFD